MGGKYDWRGIGGAVRRPGRHGPGAAHPPVGGLGRPNILFHFLFIFLFPFLLFLFLRFFKAKTVFKFEVSKFGKYYFRKFNNFFMYEQFLNWNIFKT
jgi:hypothetical protein